MERVVVTGGAGFVGSHLVDELRTRGVRVVVVDNFITGSLDNLAHRAEDDGVDFVRADISNGVSVEGSVDAVLHLASPASPRDYLEFPIQTLKAGGPGTHNALGLARAKTATFLMASTSEVYGDPTVHPQSESYWGHVNPIGPRSVYDEAKRYSEAMTMAYHRMHGIPTQIVRLFNTYGPRMRLNDGRVVPAFIDAAVRGVPLTVHGSGMQTRSFGYVEDTVRGILQVLENGDGLPVNVGTPGEMTVLEFAHLVKEIAGSDSPIVHVEAMEDDPQRREPDITRARSFGWEPRITVREGLERTVAWFRSHGVPAPRV